MDNISNMVFPFSTSTLMKEVYTIEDGPTVIAAWSKDVGTMARRLKVALVYPDGGITPIHEYAKSKLTDAKALKDLIDLDGVSVQTVENIFVAIRDKSRELAVQTDRNGGCSLVQAYQELCQYVNDYEEPGKVFVKDGYGNILATYLPQVLDKLGVGYTRLELQKNFKAWGLLRVNHGTGHEYAYKIKTGSANDWFFSFVLPDQEPEESEVAA